MELDDIRRMIAAMQASDRTETVHSADGWTLRLVRRRAAPAARTADIEAPIGGILHLRPAPDAAPFVAPGQAIAPGDALCIIEAMKVFNTIRADRAGVIAAILAPSGAEVAPGQPLMRLA